MQLIKSLARRISSLINRNVVARVDNQHKNQLAYTFGVFGQEKEIENIELYGMTTVPPVGQAESVRFCLEGYEDHTLALGASGGIYRPRDAKDGEIIFYSMWDESGSHRIHFQQNKVTEIVADKITLRAGSSLIEITNEGINLIGITTINGVEFNGHTHMVGPVTSGPPQ